MYPCSQIGKEPWKVCIVEKINLETVEVREKQELPVPFRGAYPGKYFGTFQGYLWPSMIGGRRGKTPRQLAFSSQSRPPRLFLN